MPPEREQGSIESLQRQLYSRDRAPLLRPRRALRPDTHAVPEDWSGIEEDYQDPVAPRNKVSPDRKRSRARSILSVVLAFSFLFFSIATAIAGYLFFMGSNVVSADKIDIEVSGPLVIAAGEELVVQVAITNRNTSPIQAASFVVEYPEGARVPKNLAEELRRTREEMGTIPPGGTVRTAIRGVLFGAEETGQRLLLSLEYRVEGSNAIFYKERDYSVLLSSAPVAMTVKTLQELTSGQEITLNVRLVSNATAPLKNMLLEAEYPFGFTFISATPPPTSGNAVWNIGDLGPGNERTVVVKGTLVGQDSEERIFRFRTGLQGNEPLRIASLFSNTESRVMVKRPFIQLALLFNGEGGEQPVPIPQNKQVAATIEWRNTLPDTLRDVEIIAKVSGKSLNARSIESRQGFFRSQDNSVIWNRETTRELGVVTPNSAGQVAFTFSPVPLSPTDIINDGEIMVDVSVRARRIGENDVPEIINSNVTRVARLETTIGLTGKTVYSVGPFKNTGPFPPRVEKRTTYTIILGVTNSANNIRNAVLTTSIPWYVEWLGVVDPSGADVRFNEATGALEWRIGDISAGVGYSRSPRELAIQVALEPSFSQLGQSVVLMNQQNITGVDAYTDVVVKTSRGNLTTSLSQDPAYAQMSGEVVE